MAKTTKHAFGSKENIDTAKSAGTINTYDVLHLDNGEIGWIAKDGSTVIHADRTQKAYTLNGTSFGALADGTTIPAGKTLDEIMAMATAKAIPATYTKPTVSLANNSGPASGNVEAGTSITPKLKATFTQKDSGGLTSLVIKKGSTEVANSTSSPLEYNGEAFVIGDETVTFKATASYSAAPIKQNNLGQDSTENHFGSGSIDSSGYSFTGKRNAFYGAGVGAVPSVTSDMVRGLTGKKLSPSQGSDTQSSFTINVAVGQQYIAFAYPATMRDVYRVRYNEANDDAMASFFTKTTIDVADARGGSNGLKSYKVYTYDMGVPAAATMTFTVTI